MSSSGQNLADAVDIGRYRLFHELACGGMATVYLGRLDGAVGFSRVVAIKQLHRHLLKDPDFREMFLREAHIASRIHHPNVISLLDVVSTSGEISLIMEYVHGLSLSVLCRECVKRGERPAPDIAASIMHGMLLGLHAAHEATDEDGVALDIVHRDISPQNVLVGVDGVARVFDFGVAKALSTVQETRAGLVKGKTSYMAPEQISGSSIDRRVDVFAAGVVMWELFTSRRLFGGKGDGESVYRILEGKYDDPRSVVPDMPEQLAAATMKALALAPDERFSNALEFAQAIEAGVDLAPSRAVGQWVAQVGTTTLEQRREMVRQVERDDASRSSRSSIVQVSEDLADGEPTALEPAAFAVQARRRRTIAIAAAALTAAGIAAWWWQRQEPTPSEATTASEPAVEAPTATDSPPVEGEPAQKPAEEPAAVAEPESDEAAVTAPPSDEAATQLDELPAASTTAPAPSKPHSVRRAAPEPEEKPVPQSARSYLPTEL